jgi:RNA polymerase sigma-70 factor (ECF subfamily)
VTRIEVEGRPFEATGPRGLVGDDGFDGWYRQAWPRVVRAVAVYLGRRPDDAVDLAAEAVARTFARWAGPDRPDDPTTWTIVVAVNLAKRTGAREQRGRELAVHLVDPEPHELGPVDVDLWAAVRALPDREREAVALRYAADLTEPAVAEAMGITAGAVAATLHRARTKLRAALSETHHG